MPALFLLRPIARKLAQLLGHRPSLSRHLFEIISLQQHFLDWLLAPHLQLEHHESIHILHTLIAVESCDSDAITWLTFLTCTLHHYSFLSQIRHHHKQNKIYALAVLPPSSALARMWMHHQHLTDLGLQLGCTLGGKHIHDSSGLVSPTGT